jgi:CheY-like chemotaxis protein/phosphoribosyl 1,2-cyclic phosphodiesterase
MAMLKSTPKRVLVTEDVESIAFLMKRVLEKAGFQTDVAFDGEQCLEKVASFKPDLVVMDIMMPRIHGLAALRRIKADPATSAIGVIICTAKTYKPDEEQALTDGAFAVVAKPLKPEELLAKVREYFQLASAEGKVVVSQTETGTVAYMPPTAAGEARVRIWGTRGSIPVSGNRYARYGGNTSCATIERGDDLVILDAGSGIRDLGFELARKGPSRIHLFIGHTHWDHIQGFPFFVPAFIPGFEIVLYAAPGFGKDLESIFRGQLDSDYFPVQLEDMRAKLEFKQLTEGPVNVGGLKVHWEFTQHPGATLGFKVETGDKSICYITDNEFLKGYLGHPLAAEADEAALAPYRKLIDFVSGSDIFFGEAQYTNKEYADKIGWGHSSLSNACLLAKLCKLRDWVIVHHDPQNGDETLEENLNQVRRIATEIGYKGQIRLGYDGITEYLG